MPKRKSPKPSLGIGADLEKLVAHREFAYARNPSGPRFTKLQEARKKLARQNHKPFRVDQDPLKGLRTRPAPILRPAPKAEEEEPYLRLDLSIGQIVHSPRYGYGRVWSISSDHFIRADWNLHDLPYRVLDVNKEILNAWPFDLEP